MVIKEMPIETFLKLYIASFGCVFTVFYCSIWIMRVCYLIEHFAKIHNVQQKAESDIRFTIRIYELHLHKYLKTRISLYVIMPYKIFISYKNSRYAIFIWSNHIFITTNIGKMEHLVMLHKKRSITRVARHLDYSIEHV